MPLNEILAPAYIRVKWASPIASHNLTLYFSQPTAVGVLSGDVGQLVGVDTIPYTEIVRQIADRFRLAAGVAIQGVESIEVWSSNPGAPNTFQGFAPPPTSLSGVTPPYVASAYRMWIFGQTQTRQKMRLTGFEAISASPQKFTEVVPTADDGGIGWYVLRSGVPFATQDGLRVSTYLSLNQGYNRKLARSYGRNIQP